MSNPVDATMESDSDTTGSPVDRENDARSIASVVVDPRDTEGDASGSPPPERNELHRLTGYIKSRTSILFNRSSVSAGDAESASTLPSGSATPNHAQPRPLSPRVAALVSSYSSSDVAQSVQAEITLAQNGSAATANGALLGPGQDYSGVDDDGVLKGRRRATWGTQFRILSGRAFKNLYRDPALLATHYVAAIAIARKSRFIWALEDILNSRQLSFGWSLLLPRRVRSVPRRLRIVLVLMRAVQHQHQGLPEPARPVLLLDGAVCLLLLVEPGRVLQRACAFYARAGERVLFDVHVLLVQGERCLTCLI